LGENAESQRREHKCVLAKKLNAHCRVILVDEPTRGIDVGAKAEIYKLFSDLTTKGQLAIVMVSSELPEVLGCWDRILVMKAGRIVAEFSRQDASEQQSLALFLIHRFGSLKALSRASFQDLRQFLRKRKAEALMAALAVSAIAESEHARSDVLDHPESVYRACADMKLFNQEVLRIVLLNAKQRLITMVDISKGTLNEAIAHPREIFRPVITHSAFSFILVHNHPSG
jgi:ABC-type multidrug transport system ATPase subunit